MASQGHSRLYTIHFRVASSQTLTCSHMHKRAEKIMFLLLEKGRLNTGDHVAFINPPEVDLIYSF